MKHIYTLLLGLLAWSASMAQEGVNFRDITFEEALKQAKSENKLVFMTVTPPGAVRVKYGG